ncbi:MAG: 4Fe-4S dicluster domain-containing protein [Desulfotalea sp.]
MEGRRSYLKRTGLTLLGLAASSTSGVAFSTEEQNQPKPSMIIDVNRCMGCQSCVIACKEQNKTPQGFFNTKIRKKNHGYYPSAWQSYEPSLCHQCKDAPCINVCKPNATFKLDNGIVVVDWDHCKGCGACVKACPYNARFQDSENENKVDKCDFCITLIEKGLEPACVENCPAGARILGDLANPEGEFATYLTKLETEQSTTVNNQEDRVLYTAPRKG